MNTKLTAQQVQTASLIRQIRMALGVPTAWLPVSYVMSHVQIESGFDAAVRAGDYAKTGSVGLMQVTTATAAAIQRIYAGPIADSKLPVMAEQTDPLTSLLFGMLTLCDLKGPLGRRFGNPLAYAHIAVGYNAGQGAAERMSYSQACAFPYYIKWKSARPAYAFLDAPEPHVAA